MTTSHSHLSSFPVRTVRLTGPQRCGSIVLGMLVLALPTVALGSVTPDAKEKKWPANPDKHEIVIERKSADDAEAKLIAAAEATYPPKAAVRKAADAPDAPDGDKLWWYREELGIRIPFAITAEAVAYYRGLVEGFRKQEFTRYLEPSSRFEYRATVKAHEKFEHEGNSWRDVRVVSLRLSFRQNFATTGTEGMEFVKERTVVFDADGKVVHVAGDGPTEVPVLAI